MTLSTDIEFPESSYLYYLFRHNYVAKNLVMNRISNVINTPPRIDEIENPKSVYEQVWRALSNIFPNNSIDRARIKLFVPRSGDYQVNPTTWVCRVCNLVVNYYPREAVSAQLKCHSCKTGNLEQVAVVFYCQKCGDLKPTTPWCSICKTAHRIELRRPKKDQLITWSYFCRTCRNRSDFTKYCQRCSKGLGSANGSDPKKASRMQPRSCYGSGIISPYVVSCVEFPSEPESLSTIEELSMAYALGVFSSAGMDETFEKMKKYLNMKNNDDVIEIYVNELGIPKEDVPAKLAKRCDVEDEVKKLDEFSSTFQNLSQDTQRDIIAYAGTLRTMSVSPDSQSQGANNVISYSRYVEELASTGNSRNLTIWNRLREKYNVIDIHYIPAIRLVGALIARIHGPTRSISDNPVHYVPVEEDELSNIGDYPVYTYPRLTEGILLKFTIPKDENIGEATEAQLLTRKVRLHTLSHLLIKSSIRYCGMDVDSFGEIIFVQPNALLLFSTQNVNVGGLKTLFRTGLPNWFSNIENLRVCPMDPNCETDVGACFACLYLPEYTCNAFNQDLNRREVFQNE